MSWETFGEWARVAADLNLTRNVIKFVFVDAPLFLARQFWRYIPPLEILAGLFMKRLNLERLAEKLNPKKSQHFSFKDSTVGDIEEEMLNITKLEQAHHEMLAVKDAHLERLERSFVKLEQEKDAHLVDTVRHSQSIQGELRELQARVFTGALCVAVLVIVLLVGVVLLVWRMDQEKKRLEQTIAQNQATLEEKEKHMDELRAQARDEGLKTGDLQATVARQEGVVKEKDQRIVDLQARLDDEKDRTAELYARIFKEQGISEERDERLRQLQVEVDRSKQTAAQLVPAYSHSQAPVVFTFPGVQPPVLSSGGGGNKKQMPAS